MKILKQVLIIIIVSIVLGLTVNAINPKGIQMILDKNIYALDTANQKKTLDGYINNPYDTNSNKVHNNALSGKMNKEGYIDPESITGELAKNLYDLNALFVDARTKAEYDSLHIKGAINISYEEFVIKPFSEKRDIMKKYNKDGLIVVYCKGDKCEVSIDLAYDFARLGFTSVSIYRGGMKEWKEKGHPVEP